MDRYQLIMGLLMNVDQINERYINDQVDEDTWSKELQSANHKLEVMGVQLVFRPWESGPPRKGF